MSRIAFVFILVLTGFISSSLLAQNKTRPTVPVPNGFEVNSYTGNLYQRRTDLNIPAQGIPIDITFSYNASRREKDWGLGKGWTFTYNMACYVEEGVGVWIERADGRRDLYKKSGANYQAPKGIYDKLTEYQTGRFFLETKEGTRYYFEDAGNRRLTRIQDINGNQLSLNYSDTLITSLSHSSGHMLSFAWDKGHLAEIRDNACSPELTVTYEYNETGSLAKVTNPIGDFVQYYADSSARIVGFTDEGGNNMSIFYNRNGAVSRIISCATSHTFSYVPRQFKSFVAEEANGQNLVTTYSFDEQGRVISKNGNCCGFNLEYAYDANDNVIRITDGNNKSTLYTYDSRGNVLKETDPAGNNTLYTYDPAFNRVTSITDKIGNVTSYTYDDKGNLTEVNKPLDVVEKATYDSKGNRLTYADANNAATSYAYNNYGLVTKVTDPEGGEQLFTYDCRGNVLTETDQEAHTTSYEYNALNQRLKTTDALGNVTTYTYNKLRLPASETNALGKTTTFEYDGLGRLILTTLPLGNSVAAEYDGQGNIITETDGNGHTTSYTYNIRKQPLSVTDALGHTLFYEYDNAGNKTGETDKNGNTTRFDYDDLYRLISVTDALGGTTTYNYDALGNRTAEVDPNGNITTYNYDALNRLIRTTDALGKTEENTYDGAGNVLTIKDKTGNTTAGTYDKLNRPLTITDALNGVTTYTYDAAGRIVTSRDALNRITAYSYDALGQTASISNPLNEITSYTYDAVGNIRTVTSSNGRAETHQYDDNARLVSTSDQIGTVVSYTYDANGNITSEKDGNDLVTSYEYNARNELVRTIFPNSTTIRIAYDGNGNKIKETDQKGKETAFLFDGMNRPTTLTDALGNHNRFAYDARGNLVNITDAKGNTTSYTYDGRNQLIQQTYANGSTKRYAYNPAGSLIEKTTGSGAKILYRYDALHRLSEREYPGNIKETLEYDAVGQLTKAVNANATITLTYDAAGRLLQEDNNGKATSYIYNIAGRTKTIDYPGGTKIEWELDARERLTQIRRNDSQLAGLEYDDGGRRTRKTFRNGTDASYGYDNMNNLVSLVAAPAAHLNLRYQYDAADMRTLTERLHKPVRSEQYTYDDNFQLRGFFQGQYSGGELTPTITHQYVYDPLGNRTSFREGTVEKSYQVNYLNQYTAITTNGANAPPSYDQNGNLINDGRNTYEYDLENRLVAIENPAGRVTYAYDALGRRIGRTQNGTTTSYYYDLDNVIEESIGSVVRSFVYGDEIDQILYSNVNSSEYFYQIDDLNTVQAVTDASGNLLEYYIYDPFGLPHVFDSSDQELTASSINNLLFTGRPYEFEFESYHYRNREMNPVLGRFAQRDPLEYIDGLNSYAYVNNNSLNLVDPSGLVNGWGVAGAIGGIIGNGIGFTGSAVVAFAGAPTVVGGVAGGTGMAYFGYGVGASIANLNASLRDQEPVSTGGFLGDGAKYFFPCDENAQIAGQLLDFGVGIVGGVAAVRGASNVAVLGAAKTGSNVKYLGRMEDLKGIPRSQTILDDLPNLGSPKANYYQNMSVIRRNLREGVTFKDASSFRPNSELVPTITWPTRTIRQTFYGAERNLMQNRGLWPK